MRAVAFAGLLLAAALAGCADLDSRGDTGRVSDAGECHERAAAPSGNAPLAAGFLGPPAEVLARLAAAMNATPAGPVEEPEPSRWTQATAAGGELRLERVGGLALDGPLTYVGWTGAGPWSASEAEARARLSSFLDAFGVDPASVVIEPGERGLRFRQTFEGQPLGDAGGELTHGERAELSAHALRVLPPANASGSSSVLIVTDEDARAIARTHARCLMDATGRTAAAGYDLDVVEASQLALHGGSITRAVMVRFGEPEGASHCGMVVMVQVDAMTGTVLAAGRPACS